MEERIYGIVDFILNKATTGELEVIRQALKRRYEDASASGKIGLNTQQMARDTAAQINDQMGFSRENIRAVIQKFAVNMIRQKAPELTNSQIGELLEAWVPDPDKIKTNKNVENELPSDVLLEMIRQFLSFSTESMSATEKVKLEKEIPGWQSIYWEHFPGRIKKVLKLYLKGTLDGDTCREHIYMELGIEEDS